MAGRRVTTAELVALQAQQERIRNVCILAHVDHGKTTLSDSLVSSNGVISAKLAGKLRYLDSTEEEQQRGITMKSSAISLLHTKEDRRLARLRRQQQEVRDLSKGTASAAASGGGEECHVTQANGDGHPNSTAQGAANAPPPPPPTATGTNGQTAAEEVEGPLTKDYLINLIDSPGHIDFSSDVSTATRLSDGAIVVVDVLEGVCTQTHAVLRQAWSEGMKPCLVLNKIDRLIVELKLTALEAQWHLQRVLEAVNAISASLITSETFRLEETEDYADDLEKEWLFSPERGNVVFASSLYCWAFSVSTFARIWAKKLGMKKPVLQRHLWGDYSLNSKTLAITTYTADSASRGAKPMFVSMILDPIWQLYDVTVANPDFDRVAKMIKRLELEVPPRELNPRDTRGTASSIFRRWLPLAEAVLDMVVDVIPDPVRAQHRRITALWPAQPTMTALHAGPSTSATETPVSEPSSDDENATERVRDYVSHCRASEDAPVVVFVSKVVPVRAVELPPEFRPPPSSEGDSPDVFVAFARVFSGVLRPGVALWVLGPKYHPQRRSTSTHTKALPPTHKLGLFMMMGTALHQVPEAPAGNLVAIVGLEGLVLKSATLASTLACPALSSMTLQAKPMVRVAVEVTRQGDLAALERGLAKLYQADPAVEVSVQETGEHVIAALGELHLEQCLKDLRERYARVEVKASAPLVTFRESLALEMPDEQDDRPPQLSTPPWSDEEGTSTAAGCVCRLETPGHDCRLTIRCIALPDNLARLLDAEPMEVRSLLTGGRVSEDDEGVTVEDGQPQVRKFSHLSNDGNGHVPFRERVVEAMEDVSMAGGGWKLEEDVLAFGPRNVGPNVLLRKKGMRVRMVVVKTSTTDNSGTNGSSHRQAAPSSTGGGSQSSTSAWQSPSTAVEEVEVLSDDTDLAAAAWRGLQNCVVTGFQLTTASGPMAEEQMYGVGMIVEDVTLLLPEKKPQSRAAIESAAGDGAIDGVDGDRSVEGGVLEKDEWSSGDVREWLTMRLGSLTGQVMSSCKSACRAAFLASPARLVEALFKCDLQCDRLQLGKLYGVLSRRRGRVVEEDIIEGTDLFIIKALLPVAESFGFANELLKKTSGAATSPQLAFSHWELMDVDPFWKPRNEEDREEFGEVTHEVNIARKYIDDTRRRKGLPLGEKIVIFAEKQRTLKRNK